MWKGLPCIFAIQIFRRAEHRLSLDVVLEVHPMTHSECEPERKSECENVSSESEFACEPESESECDASRMSQHL